MEPGPKHSIRNHLMTFHQCAGLVGSNEELDDLLEETIRAVIDLAKWNERLLTEKELEALYPVFSARGLRRRRSCGNGPSYYKIGETRNSPIYYKIGDVEAWLQAHHVVLDEALYAKFGVTGKPD